MNKLLILGSSYNDTTKDILDSWQHDLWACNTCYKDASINTKIKLIGMVNQNVVEEYLKYYTRYNYSGEVISPLEITKKFKNYIGKTTAIEMLNEAVSRDYDEIYILGFNSPNVVKQLNEIKDSRIYNLDLNPDLLVLNINKPIITTAKQVISISEVNANLNAKLDKLSKNKKELNFLIFGNDNSINDIDLIKYKESIQNSDLITVGVNRIWRRFKTDIFYILDCLIVDEMALNNVKNDNDDLWLTSEFIYNNPEMKFVDSSNVKSNYIKDNNFFVLDDPKVKLRKSSIIWVLYYLKEVLFKDRVCNFYLYGISLKVDNSHFWENDSNVLTVDLQKKENSIKLQGFYNSHVLQFKELKKKGYNLFSLTKDSKLNDFIEYKDINLINFVNENIHHKLTVLQYRKTKIAYVPDVMNEIINKYSNKYKSIIAGNLNCNFDVVHFHNRFENTNKPKFIHYHSEPVGSNAMPNFDGAKYCIAQYPALYKEYGDFGLVRNIVDLDLPEYKYQEIKNKIIVAYTPSTLGKNSRYSDKGYAETYPILEKLKKKYPNKFDFIFVNGKPLKESIEAKSKANVIIDECITGSYHRCTLEGLAMGKYVISYVQPEIESMFMKVSNSKVVPYHNVNIKDLENHLEDLIINKGVDYIIKEGKKSWDWMRKYWNHLDILKEFENMYDLQIIENKFENYIRGKKVIFVCPSKILEGQGLGEWIDSFDIVIRTNNFFPVNEKIVKDYGKKCDILYVNVQMVRECSPFPVEKLSKLGLEWICFKAGISKKYNDEYSKYLNIRSCSGAGKKLSTEIDGLLTGTIIVEDIIIKNPKEFYISGMNFYSGNQHDWENQYIDTYLPKKVLLDAIKKRNDGFFDLPTTKYHNLEANKKYIIDLYNKNLLEFDNITKKELGIK